MSKSAHELRDIFMSNPDNVSQWYAILSNPAFRQVMEIVRQDCVESATACALDENEVLVARRLMILRGQLGVLRSITDAARPKAQPLPDLKEWEYDRTQ